MGNLFQELKRRMVFRVAAVYAVVAWLLIQVAATVFPTLQMPGWTVSFVTVLFLLGFPIAVILAWAYEATPLGIRPDSAARTQTSAPQNQNLIYAMFVLLLLAVGLQLGDRFLSGDESVARRASSTDQANSTTDPVRLEINLPAGLSIEQLDVSPDGSRLLFSVDSESAGSHLWLRAMNELEAHPLPGTLRLTTGTLLGGQEGRFSSDGNAVVFTRANRIETLRLTSNVQTVLLEDPYRNFGGIWGQDDSVYYPGIDKNLWRMPAAGGEPELLAPLPGDYNSTTDLQIMEVLPGQRGILYKPSRSEIAILSLPRGEITLRREADWARYAKTGHLLFNTADGDLLAAPLDLDSLTLSGPEVPLVNGRVFRNFALSDNGVLAYPARTNVAPAFGRVELVWIDRAGAAQPLEPGWEFNRPPNAGWRLSPDGSRVAYQSRNDIWIKELPDGPEQRLTLTGGTNGLESRHPDWSSDSRSIVYELSKFESTGYDLWQIPTEGSGDAHRLLEVTGGGGYLQPRWSRDGEWLVMRSQGDGTRIGDRNIFGFRPGQDNEVTPLVANPQYAELAPMVSPDGRWLVYSSDESGRDEIYVRPFPDVNSGRWQISTDGGIGPLWSHAGNEIFFVDAARNVVSAQLETGDALRVTQRTVLFNLGPEYYVSANNNFIDIAPDDQHFLLGRSTSTEHESAVVVLNFFNELREKMGQ